MTEDKLLNDLGDLARREEEEEQARLDERWDRLAAGTLSAEEDAELRALAETSPEIREAYEAFRPLGSGFEARVTAAATAELARGPAPELAPVPEQQPSARLLPFRRGAARPLAWLGSMAAAAAVLFFFVRSPGAPLPAYNAALEGGDLSVRGDKPVPADRLPVFTPGSLLTLTAQPAKTVEGAVKARIFFSAGDGDLRPLDAEPRIADSGAARFQGRLGQEIELPPGRWRLWIVIGRPGAIPAGDELAAALRAGRLRGDGWQAISQDLRVDDRASP